MPTYDETVKAINDEIEKWERIYAGTEFDDGAENDARCKMFPDCRGCPADYVHDNNRCDPEYADWHYHQITIHNARTHRTVQCKFCEKQALNVRNSLIALLPVVDEMFEKEAI